MRYKPTPEFDRRLKELVDSGLMLMEIADRMDASYNSVRSRIRILGLRATDGRLKGQKERLAREATGASIDLPHGAAITRGRCPWYDRAHRRYFESRA